MTKAYQLVAFLSKIRNGKLAIVLHDSPDPDAIGSGLGLKKIAEKFNIKADLMCSGIILNTQNKRTVDALKINILDSKTVDFRQYSKIAVVDVSHSGPHLTIPPEFKINIVIDHHTSETNKTAEFVDIRQTNSCSSIMVDYLKKLKIRLDSKKDQPLIITLFEGIRIDTNNLLYFNHFDMRAAEYLSRYLNFQLYENIRESFISEEESQVVAKAINSSLTKNRFKVAYVGEINYKSAFGIVQAVNFLLGVEEVDTTIVYGFQKIDNGYQIISSIRNIRQNRDAGRLAKEIFETGGGRKESAGAQVNVSGKKELEIALKKINRNVNKTIGTI